MFSFEYSIELNPHGRPVIAPSEKTDKELDFIEHKFMALELARTIITNTISSDFDDPKKYKLRGSDLDKFFNLKEQLEEVCDIYAETIKDQMDLMDETNSILNPNDKK